MEEPPRIDRIISSQGVSLVDAASLLKSFLLDIDQYHGHHHHHRRDGDGGRDIGDSLLSSDETRADERRPTTSANNNDGGTGTGLNDNAVRRTWQEREEEALIAQMDQLAAGNNSATGVSDDVLERLGMITRSICAEVEGRPLSASGVLMTSGISNKDGYESTREIEEMGGRNDDIGDDDFLAGSEEAEGSAPEERRRQKRQQQHQQRPREEDMVVNTNKDKKKEKKAKKAAKKAKKDAKRKAKELGDSHEKNDSKRVKLGT